MSEAIIPWLFGFTLAVFIAWGVWQWWSARKATDKHEHSATPPPVIDSDGTPHRPEPPTARH